MEENTGSSNFNQSGGHESLPNAAIPMVLGIVSIVASVLCCCFYGQFPGLVAAIIGMVMGNGALKKYNENPTQYSEKSYKQVKTGRMLSIIGLIVASLMIIFFIVMLVSGTSPNEYRDYMEKYR